MIIKLILSLLVIKNYRHIYLNEPNAYIYPSKFNEITGYGERFPKNETINYNEIYNINRNLLIKKVIYDLEDSNNSMVTKMNILDKYSFLIDDDMEVDIKKGGLLNDFYFEII